MDNRIKSVLDGFTVTILIVSTIIFVIGIVSTMPFVFIPIIIISSGVWVSYRISKGDLFK